MTPAAFSSGPSQRRFDDQELDWNPPEDIPRQGNLYPSPTPDAAAERQWAYRDDHGRSRSADRRQGGGSSIGNMPRRENSPPPLLERAPEHVHQQQGNAAYYDTGPRSFSSRRYRDRQQHRPRQHRAYTTDDLVGHPFWNHAHMHPGSPPVFPLYPSPSHSSPGWGNEDAYVRPEEEELYLDARVKSYHDKRHHDLVSSREQREESEFVEARRRHEREEWPNADRGGRGQNRRTQDAGWGPSDQQWGPGLNNDWNNIDGDGGGGGGWGMAQDWATAVNEDPSHRENGPWGNDSGERDAVWGWGGGEGERDGERDGVTIRSYKVIRPRSRDRDASATGSSWTHVKSTPSTGPILVSEVPPTALERSLSDGATPTLTSNSMKKLTRLFGGGSGNVSIHPFLRPPGLLRPTTFYWDVRRLPDPARSGIKIGEAVAGLNEPATNPPLAQIRILVPIPTLHGAMWSVNILSPSDHRVAKLPNPTPVLPYSFVGSPTSFGQKITKVDQHYLGSRHLPGYVRVADVLHGLHTMLFKPVRKGDWRALEKHHQDAAGEAFYVRCNEIESNDGRVWVYTPTRGTEEIDQAVAENIKAGLKRVDVLIGRTKFDGIEPTGQFGEWQVRLAKSNDRMLGFSTRGL